MKKYFFIPADDVYKLRKSVSFNVDYIIADLEDSVVDQNYNRAISNLLKTEDIRVDYIRIDPVKHKFDDYHKVLFEKYPNIVYPKIDGPNSMERFLQFTKEYDLEYILLIEHPWLLLNLDSLLSKTSIQINGLAFGSHDFSVAIGVDQYSDIIKHARVQLVLASVAYNIKSIDIASMEISNESVFKRETIEGSKMGYSGKFLIHPNQLFWFEELSFNTRSEIEWAEKVIELMDSVGEEKPITKLDGQIIEKPHLLLAKKILNRNK